MNFRTVLLCLGLLSIASNIISQTYSQITIPVDEMHLDKITRLGLALDHAYISDGTLFVIANQWDIDRLEHEKIPFEIVLADAELREPIAAEGFHRSQSRCGPNLEDRILTPRNYQPGSVQGQYTYVEMISQLQAMRAAYPHLISDVLPIGDFTTHHGLPIYFLRISDNPDVDEDENEILYTALHHAREPMSMHQMIFYMWYLLENYEISDQIRYLVDNVEMYFVPCVNPDGYNYNLETNPQGGGLWRKNRRDNGAGVFGVDINRNYGFEWAHDDSGSSDWIGSEVYRGPEPFSEPETQAIRHLCLSHDFQIAMNYHSYGNFLIYPYGFTDDIPAEATVLENLAKRLTRSNQYIYGTGLETVQYFTNGDADDWMFGERAEKNIIYSFTAEVGTREDFFWPHESRILPLAKENVTPNLAAASFLVDPADIFDLSKDYVTDLMGEWRFRMEKLGFGDAALQLRIEPITDNISFDLPNRIFILSEFGLQNDAFAYQLDPSIQVGDAVAFQLTIDNGISVTSDTIVKSYQIPDIVYRNDGQSTDFVATGWLSQWGRTEQEFYTAPAAFADSPFGNYLPNSVNEFSSLDKIFIPQSDSVYLQFWTKWDIEPGKDFAQVLISTDDQDFIPMCGKYTEIALNIKNAEGEPAYLSSQPEWLLESIDLSPFMGQLVRLRFLLLSNGDDTRDGLYVDDIELISYKGGITTSTSEVMLSPVTIFPNPSSEVLNVHMNESIGSWSITNFIGSVISNGSTVASEMTIDVSDLPSGMYIFQSQHGISKKIIIQ